MRLYWWLLCCDSCRVHPIAHNYNRPIFLIDYLLLVMSREIFFEKTFKTMSKKVNSHKFLAVYMWL